MNSKVTKGSKPREWPETQWEIIEGAGDADNSQRHQAIGQLVQEYLPALEAHLVIRKGMERELAKDFLQDFFLKKFVQQNLPGHADRQKGKFRSFILRSLENFLLDFYRSKQYKTQRREISNNETPDAAKQVATDVFDKTWAIQVFYQAVRNFKQQCHQRKQRKRWIVFRDRLLRPVFFREPQLSFEQICRRIDGEISTDQVRNVLAKAKQSFATILRSVINQYVTDTSKIDEEMDYLLSILKRTNPLDDLLEPFHLASKLFEEMESTRFDSQHASHLLDNTGSDETDTKNLKRQWSELLKTPLAEVLTDQTTVTKGSGEEPRIISDVLNAAEPSIEHLASIKAYAKDRLAENKDSTCCYALYLVCIATAKYKFGKLLSQTPADELKQKFDVAREYLWLDTSSVEKLSIASKRIGN